ncbi:hypothetical protein BDQ94DRAFT_145060 [Aspergillus welwitschiae]|uniref:Uncharacterized protein n=1 Tax=Aspergillus welwitschiae TaxID=1341132 RepID=A0A3F3Q1D2_9EURO|nr:hypothetical protein BDQ94DRAFT_145060 [Aspergillus welwitschiae]RDH32802.1 hypothetical protein BDQ94DRAFT_145060 [Aspergillus welwitschiae]
MEVCASTTSAITPFPMSHLHQYQALSFVRIAGQSFSASGLGQINRAVMLSPFPREYGMIF